MQLTLLRVRLGHGLSVAALVVAGVLASAAIATGQGEPAPVRVGDRKSTRLNSSHRT